MEKILEFIMISGIAIVLLLIFMLVKAKKKELHFKLLFFFFFITLNYLAIGYGDINKFNLLILICFPVVDNIEFLLGPLLFFYIEALFNHRKKITKKDLIHFIPAGSYFIIFTIPEMISFFVEKHIFRYLETINDYEHLVYVSLMVYLTSYVIISKLKFDSYQKIHKANYANSSVVNITWVNHLLIGVLIVCSIDLTIEIIAWILHADFDSYFTMILAAFLIIYLGYYGINQSKILLPEGSIEFKNKNVKPTEFIKIKNKLEQLLEKDHIYRDENINLQILADKININPKKLSYLLNNYLNTSFHELINKKRIEDVKLKIASPNYQQHTLIEIAYDCGFQSKASFNRIFKKETNLSPTEYKKTLLKQNK